MKNNPLGPRPAPEADPSDLGAAGLVLAALREAGSPLRVGEIAQSVGSHDNTVRGHLTILLRLDLVESETAPAQGRGRPAVLYSAGPRPGVRTAEFRSLAGAFAADLVRQGSSSQVRGRARRIGRAWGESLAAHPTKEAAEPDLDVALADLGFGPQRDGEVVRLTTCPLLDLAVANPDVICQVHLGLVDGIIGDGEGEGVAELTPFAEPGACLLRVPRTA